MDSSSCRCPKLSRCWVFAAAAAAAAAEGGDSDQAITDVEGGVGMGLYTKLSILARSLVLLLE